MNFQVLISTMYLDKNNLHSFLSNMNVKSQAIIVNQCNENSCVDIIHNGNKVKLINTTTRGLSISRNIALKNATSNYCLICDDDEYLFDNIEQLILESFSKIRSDLLCFKVENLIKKDFNSVISIGYLTALRVSSVQIAFNRDAVLKNNIIFDELVGAGVSAGGGEENIFLFDCLKKGLIIKKTTVTIAKLLPSVSTWVSSYNEAYFNDKGKLFSKLFAFPIDFLFMNYFIFSKRKLFAKDINLFIAYKSLLKGLFS